MIRSGYPPANIRMSTRLVLLIGCCLGIGYYFGSILHRIQSTNALVQAVNLVDPRRRRVPNNLTCIKAKRLLNLYRTTICLHEGRDYVSRTLATELIWEEDYVVRLLNILIRNPHLDMIDIGANIGGYTMFTAGALCRLTIVIDCYLPNIERIVRAVQIENVENRVVLVHNALYAKSGEYLKLSMDNPSRLYLTNKTKKDTSTHFVVQTIRFDDLIPLLIEKGVRTAVVKIDVEGSESYLCETGTQVFDLIDIQLVMMEWGHGMRKMYPDRYRSIVDFFTRLNYVATDEKCNVLDFVDWQTTWPGNIYWIKQVNFRKNIC